MIPAWVALPAPGGQVEFDTGHGEYTLVGGDAADVWFIVGGHGTEVLDAFAAELTRNERGFSLNEMRPEVATRFAD